MCKGETWIASGQKRYLKCTDDSSGNCEDELEYTDAVIIMTGQK